VDFHELEATELAVDGLHQRALAHAACAPKERVVGGEPLGKAFSIGQKRVPHPVDPLEKLKRDAIDLLDREKASSLCLPDESVARPEIWNLGPLRTKALERPRNPLNDPCDRFLKVHVGPVAKAREPSIVAQLRGRARSPGRETGPRLAESGHP
jgi:hypothetical protein